jgi:hypothetical protein
MRQDKCGLASSSPLKWTKNLAVHFSGLELGSLGIDPQVVLSGANHSGVRYILKFNPALGFYALLAEGMFD